MATEGNSNTITRAAGADMLTDDFLYHAIALDDGLVAANGKEAVGLLQSKPTSGEGALIGIDGVMKYRAGGAVAARAALTVAASGWIITAGSGYHIIGRNGETAVVSGAVGNGHFDFRNPIYAFSSSFI